MTVITSALERLEQENHEFESVLHCKRKVLTFLRSIFRGYGIFYGMDRIGLIKISSVLTHIAFKF